MPSRLPGQGLLELDREEAVDGSGHDPDRDRRPVLEVAHRPRDRVGLGTLAGLSGGGDLRRNVVQEVDGQIELAGVTAALGGELARPRRAGVLPPRPGRLTGTGKRSPRLGLRS
jgi:hypothetical protein